MIKKLRSLSLALVLFSLSAAISSCSTKMRAVNQLENLSVDLRDNSSRYTIADWEEAAYKFVEIRKDIHKHEYDYTPEQKKRIGELEGNCAKYMVKGAKDGLLNRVQGFAEEINGILKGILF